MYYHLEVLENNYRYNTGSRLIYPKSVDYVPTWEESYAIEVLETEYAFTFIKE